MATFYTEIYARFTPKITNYSFANLTKADFESQVEPFLKAAIVNFRSCDKLSDRDELTKQFNITLTDEEQEILAILMSIEYLSPRLITDDLLRQKLSVRDYRINSQANHIKEVRSIQNELKKDADKKMTLYTYKKSKLDELL